MSCLAKIQRHQEASQHIIIDAMTGLAASVTTGAVADSFMKVSIHAGDVDANNVMSSVIVVP